MTTNDTRGLWRGKRMDNNGWVCGVPLQHCDGDWQLISGKVGAMIIDTIIPDTLGKCAGIPDKNKKLIFEGDIVRFTDELGVVRFGRYTTIDGGGSHVGFYVEWRGKADGLRRNDLGYLCEIIEVVGNIYDTPALLKGADKP